MFARIQIAKDMPHHTFFIDHESCAVHAYVRFAIRTVIGEYFIFLHYFALCIGQQLQRETVLVAKFFMHQAIVTRNPEDRKSTRLNSSHLRLSRMPSSA